MKQNLLQSVAGATNCDKNVLQGVTDITKCDSYYKVKCNTCALKKPAKNIQGNGCHGTISVLESFEYNKYALGVSIDLPKAFDTVDHSMLVLAKVRNELKRPKTI